jgi:RimJ/RimL family protein N-acetyltransferase
MKDRQPFVNVHERHIAGDPDEIGGLLETWGSAGDRFWCSELLVPASFRRGLEVGSRGGHGAIRYRVVEHTPGRSVRVEFEPGVGLRGHHGFEIHPTANGECRLRHELVATPEGVFRAAWPLFRPVHDAGVEDILDHVERTVTGTAHRPRPASRLAAFTARRLLDRWVERCDDPPGPLQTAALARTDVSSCWTTPLLPNDPNDPAEWAQMLFGGPPGALLRMRDLIVKPLGLEPSRTSGQSRTIFPQLAFDQGELMLGADDRHLSFRIGLKICDRTLHLTTTVQIHNRLGRVYWSIVRLVDPIVQRRILRRCPLPAEPNRTHTPPTVDLRPVDESTLDQLVEAAIADAEPDEVTPPLGNGWTAERLDWLRHFHRDRSPGLDGPLGEATWAIWHDSHVVGSVRLHRLPEPSHGEIGIWLTRRARGHRLGTQAVGAVIDIAAAAGLTAVVAKTTSANGAVISMLHRLSFTIATNGDQVTAMKRLHPNTSR